MQDESANLIGRVKSVCYTLGESHIQGIEFMRGWLKSAFVPLDGIKEITPEWVRLKDGDYSERVYERSPEDVEFARGFSFTAEQFGKDIGFVSTLFIDEKTGRIEGVEISRSLMDDLKQGRTCARQFTPTAENTCRVDETYAIERSTGDETKFFLRDRSGYDGDGGGGDSHSYDTPGHGH